MQTATMGGVRSPHRHDAFCSEGFVKRIRAGENDAICALVKAYNKQLVHAALGLGFDLNIAFDVVQNVWCSFMEVAPRFEGRSHVRTFLFGMLYNKAKEMWREQNRFGGSDPVERILEKRFNVFGQWISPPIAPEKFLLASETMEVIEQCLESLPLAQRTAFSLKEMQDCSSKEICKIMNITVSNLGALLYRARSRLRECIENQSKDIRRRDDEL